jgi:glycosyltransferase involved in cell wall biosynthesis
MKKICIDARMISKSGIGTVIKNVIPGLMSHFRVTVLGNCNELSKMDFSKNAVVIPIFSGIYTVKEHLELARSIPPCDLFWSPHFNIPVAPIKARKRLVTIHDVYHLSFFNTLKMSQKIYAKIFYNLSIFLSDGVTTVSDFSKREIDSFCVRSFKKIAVIKHAVDHNIFKATQEPTSLNNIKRNLNLWDNFILYVGNVKPHKNLQRLVLAFDKYIRNNGNECQLVIVGEKGNFITNDPKLFQLIEKLNINDRICFTGYVSDHEVAAIYKLATVFVSPSLYEGFGLTPLEAMACGCPTIVSQIPAHQENCGDASIYFDPNSTDDLCEKVKSVLSNRNLMHQHRIRGLRHVKQFHWKNSVKQYIDFIQSIIA